jgi:CopG family nickel-responsive transcriptional regulator
MEETERFGVSMNQRLLKRFDRCIQRKGYQSRSEAIRDIVRDYLVASEWESGKGEVVGTVTIVYDHHTRELNRVLTNLQHQCHQSIVCTTHVHLDAHNCLEVVVVKGNSQQVRAIADRLIGTRGVKHGKLVCTTTGRALV